MKLERKEIKYILWAFAISFIWMILVIPNIDKIGISSNYLIRFLIFNVGIFVLLQVVLKGIITSNSIRYLEVFGLLLIANAIDLLAPPFVWNTLGQANTNILLSEASTDFLVGSLWQSVGASGFYIYLLTYVISPVLLLVVAGLLIKNFVRRI